MKKDNAWLIDHCRYLPNYCNQYLNENPNNFLYPVQYQIYFYYAQVCYSSEFHIFILYVINSQ